MAHRTPLSDTGRFLIAGLGGLVPVTVSFVTLDTETVFADINTGAVLGYLAKIVGLFLLGGLAGWIHTKEFDRKKLLQLGIGAPALLVAGVNGVKASGRLDQALVPFAWIIPEPAYAQIQDDCVHRFVEPKESLGAAFWRGLTGAQRGPWFIYLQEPFYNNPTDAFRRARLLRVPSRVYPAFPDQGRGYVVVVGDWLSGPKAEEVAERLRVEFGLDVKSWLAPPNIGQIPVQVPPDLLCHEE